MNQRVLVTGAAGFIGMHASRALLEAGIEVVGVDNLDPYYDVRSRKRASQRSRRSRDSASNASISRTRGRCSACSRRRLRRRRASRRASRRPPFA